MLTIAALALGALAASPPASAATPSARSGSTQSSIWHVNKIPASWHNAAAPASGFASAAVCSNPNTLWNENSNLVMEVYNSSTANGAKVDQWSSNGTNTQKWCFFQEGTWSGSPYYEIVNQNSGKCLELNGGNPNTVDGGVVDQWTCEANHPNEWWWIGYNASPGPGEDFIVMTQKSTDEGGDYVAEIYHSQKTRGARVDLWQIDNTATQQWCPVNCSG